MGIAEGVVKFEKEIHSVELGNSSMSDQAIAAILDSCWSCGAHDYVMKNCALGALSIEKLLEIIKLRQDSEEKSTFLTRFSLTNCKLTNEQANLLLKNMISDYRMSEKDVEIERTMTP